MSSQTHTKGPWSADKWAPGWSVSGDHSTVCRLGDCNNADANARLIAAAPELLNACKTALLAFETMIQFENSRQYCDPGQMALLRGAIAKAVEEGKI